ncbi:Disintegrin and metalloproteinase domain-containing protein 11 [Varanus komodoensis]|nr:Disintegrin and metalloproteinase domain-containing protein 11 [Varanus komodoensis]
MNILPSLISYLLSSHYIERHFGQDGNASYTTGASEHCYYQGSLRGEANSFASLSSCHGLHGVFSDGKATYLLEPYHLPEHQEGSVPHQIYRTPVPRTAQGCTEPGCLFAALNDYIPSGLPKVRHRRQVHRGHRTVHSETKFIELIVVNDHQLFEQLRHSVVLTSNFAKSVVNLADLIYKEQLNTRIVLVAMETWASGDKIQVDQDSLETLSEFMKYRQDALPEQSDAVHLFSGRTFRSSRSGTAYVGGICSVARGGGVNEYGNVGAMAVTLAQTLGQNIGMMWNKHRTSAGDCRCPDSWLGCIMEDTGYYLPRKFSRCSIDQYNQFLAEGGGSCLFNKPLKVYKLLDPPECGNGFVEAGEECDCGSLAECSKVGGNCCKKCTLTHDAMCSDGLCCRGCKYEPRGVTCREAVNECDIPETCTGDSSQCPPNLHKQDGYFCDNEQVRAGVSEAVAKLGIASAMHCGDVNNGTAGTTTSTEMEDQQEVEADMENAELRKPDEESLWRRTTVWSREIGRHSAPEELLDLIEKTFKDTYKSLKASVLGLASAERLCYEKLNVEGTERGNCGHEGNRWVPCIKQDVLCGYLLCANVTGSPRVGELLGEITTMTFYHQKRYVDCRGGHVQLVDGTDISYVEDGTPCGPSMLCLDHKCLPVSAFNFSVCPGSWGSQICFDHGVCSNEGQCICYPDWTGKDCSVYDPIIEPKPTGETEKYKGPSGTNIIIGSIAGAILVAAIVLGGTGWGFK